MIKEWARCPLSFRYTYIDRLPTKQSSALTFGTIIHDAVLHMEQQGSLAVGLDTFNQWWDKPEQIDPELKIDVWIAKHTWANLRDEGHNILKRWWEVIKWDTDVVIAREHHFVVPVGEHELEGTLDKLKLTWDPKTGNQRLLISDYKSTRKVPTYEYLEHDLQFTAYCLATHHPSFWSGIHNGEQLFGDFQDLPRYGEWVHLQKPKRLDAGIRTDMHYNRLRYAIDQIAESVAMRIFPPIISGETCAACFGPETLYWTSTGIRTLGETAGTTQRVLTRGESGGVWADAQIQSFGIQKLYSLELKKGKRTKIVRTTADHGWFVRTRKDPARTDHDRRTTAELQPGDVLLATTPRPHNKTIPSPVGIMAGIVFGDGSRTAKRKECRVALYEGKMELADYFRGHSVSDIQQRTTTVQGKVYTNKVIVVEGLPRFMKDPPNLNESASYLLGWLMGYVATDGAVNRSTVTINSSKKTHVELAQTVAALVGIYSHNITTFVRKGLGQDKTASYTLRLGTAPLSSDFFVRSTHRDAFVPLSRSDEKLEWRVMSIEEDATEEVFCATVPDYGTFTLDDFIATSNCDFRGTCGIDPETIFERKKEYV